MKIILIGPPGSGKGVQCELISQKFGIVHVSVGELLREQVRKKTRIGQEVKGFLDRGDLVPTGVIIALLRRRLARKDANNGFVLDGFPRSLEQAEEFGAGDIDHVVYLSVPPSVVKARLAKRKQCVQCGHVAIGEHACGKCGSKLVVRSDDRPTVIQRRLDVFRKAIIPVLRFYRSSGVLHRINGAKSIKSVFSDITAMLRLT